MIHAQTQQELEEIDAYLDEREKQRTSHGSYTSEGRKKMFDDVPGGFLLCPILRIWQNTEYIYK